MLPNLVSEKHDYIQYDGFIYATTCVIIIFRLGCIREHCIISSGFPPYASDYIQYDGYI